MSETKDVRPLIAVITRTKDRPLLLKLAIKSFLGQSLNDYVMVIVNDGGDSKVIEDLVDPYKQSAEGRLTILHNYVSMGMQAAANKGIQSVDSKYVVIHDDDDTWDGRFLEKTTDHLEKSGAMAVVTSTDVITEEIDGDTINVLGRARMLPDMKHISLYKMCFENQAAPIALIFNRNVFETIGYFDESLRGFGDWDFGLRLLLHYDIDYLNLPEALAFYHQRPHSDGLHLNSVFTDDQQYLENLMFNRYLRDDIRRGQLGLGYIINSLRNGRTDGPTIITTILQRIDEQTNRVTEFVSENTARLEDAMTHQPKGVVSLLKQATRTVSRQLSRRD
jgi:glycosyltransferase involved in cell wall biosynthesis